MCFIDEGLLVITENQLEKLYLEWFRSIGCDYICGYDIAPDDDSVLKCIQILKPLPKWINQAYSPTA